MQVMFQGELRPEQQVAAAAMLKHEMGVLAATTAFGKTAWLIAQRGINTLVLVHRKRFSIVGWKRCPRHEDGSS